MTSPTPFVSRLAAVLRALPRPKIRWWWAIAPVLALAVVAYYAIGMMMLAVLDDNPDFGPGTVIAGQSRATAMAARLIYREVDQNGWTANDPFFKPSWMLDNMPNYQQGIIAALSSFTSGLSELSARVQDAPDSDLERAAQQLTYPGTVWMFDPRNSWSPTASAEKQYRGAARALERFNQRLPETHALPRSADDLLVLLNRVADDLASGAMIIDQHLSENGSSLFDCEADDIFFFSKGRLYTHALLLRELGWDYAAVISQYDLGDQWREMVEDLRDAATLDPPVIINGAPDSVILPSHLTAQGYYLLKARARVDELAQALSR